MTKNPLINALSAALYIAVVVLFIGSFSEMSGPDTLLIPMFMLALLVLSVLTMGYVLLFTPAQMFFDGDKKGAAALFLKTLVAFAMITVCFLALMLVAA